MADGLADDLMGVIELAQAQPSREKSAVILAFGSARAILRARERAKAPARGSDAELFERWLIERWLREIRSDAFHQSADYHYLVAEWERSQ